MIEYLKISILIAVLSSIVIYLYPNVMNTSSIVMFANMLTNLKFDATTMPSSQSSQSSCLSKGERLMTREELSNYDGTGNSKGLYLGFLGTVYDVSKGANHYRPGGAYSFFAGKDATRAFVTGEFDEKGLIDDLEGIKSDGFESMQTWIDLYNSDYTKIGRVIGAYYDHNGCPTDKLKWVHTQIENGKTKNTEDAEEAKLFPYCNSEWNHETKSGRVWCSRMSGGQQRDWIGVPRQLFNAEKKQYRCACVKNFGAPSVPNIEYADDDHTDDDKNRVSHDVNKSDDIGDLANPRLKEYEDCDPKSFECKMKDEK